MPPPFKFLGFTHDGRAQPKYIFYFIADNFGYPTSIQQSSMFRNGSRVLHNIAPPAFWRAVFPGGTKRSDGVDWIRANDWVTTKSFQAGIYAPPRDGIKVYKNLTARNAPKPFEK